MKEWYQSTHIILVTIWQISVIFVHFVGHETNSENIRNRKSPYIFYTERNLRWQYLTFNPENWQLKMTKNGNFQVHFWVALKLSEILRCSTSCIVFKEKKIWDGNISSSVQKINWKTQKISITDTFWSFSANFGINIGNIENSESFSLKFYSLHFFFRKKYELILFRLSS